MTRLALNLSGYVNGVASRHAETTARMFPGYNDPRHHQRRACCRPGRMRSFRRLFTDHFPAMGS